MAELTDYAFLIGFVALGCSGKATSAQPPSAGSAHANTVEGGAAGANESNGASANGGSSGASIGGGGDRGGAHTGAGGGTGGGGTGGGGSSGGQSGGAGSAGDSSSTAGSAGTFAVAGATGCDDATDPRCAVRVFVTSGIFNGKFAGPAGADSVCQRLADAAALNGKFVAWLGVGSSSGADRVPHSPAPYRRLDGVIVAQSWAALSAKLLLEKPISVDENGVEIVAPPGTVYAWTGARLNGASVGDCTAWTDNSTLDGAAGGDVTQAKDWLQYAKLYCNDHAHLYCFEVPAGP